MSFYYTQAMQRLFIVEDYNRIYQVKDLWRVNTLPVAIACVAKMMTFDETNFFKISHIARDQNRVPMHQGVFSAKRKIRISSIKKVL